MHTIALKNKTLPVLVVGATGQDGVDFHLEVSRFSE
jgi:hypothetical protein